MNILEGAGVFIWPLGLCSVTGIFIFFERLLALRAAKVIPRRMREAFVRGELPAEGSADSAAGRILQFYFEHKPDPEQLKAYARWQIIRLERGLFLLEIVVSASPLLGLLGTVTGLIKVFAKISPDTGMPDPAAFVEGIALALSTTMLGLAIAIPALAGSIFLHRRVDILAAQLNVGVEQLVNLARRRP